MGSYRAIQGVPALPVIPCEDRLQSTNLHNVNTQPRCYGHQWVSALAQFNFELE